MRIVIAPDSFKESASAQEVAEAIAAGWRRVYPYADLILTPMADGGEGTVDALVAATAGERLSCEVSGPLGDRVMADYGLLGDGRTAVIEMAEASGLALVEPTRRDPRAASTRGTGELMRAALDRGAKCIILGVGGSATNDAGAGMAQALGYRLLDASGEELPPGGAALARLARIDAADRHPALDACTILVACDVDNPLCGPKGASCVFGPQKGADAQAVDELEGALAHWASVVEAQLGVCVQDVPGAGAAGGLAAGLMAFAGAKLESGVDLVAQACGLEERMAGADLVITGEGRLDDQSAGGKTPVGVARIAKRANLPVVALAGTLGDGYRALYAEGIDAMLSISPGPGSLEEAMAQTTELLRDAAETVARLWSEVS
ncbi:MAG: glycerate kinase [Nitrospiraceae bacterium]|nr:glycerate kinase [Nitrospiraceae bacterium]